jgi:hypothetical protein
MREHGWWGAALALLAATLVVLTTGLVGISVYLDLGAGLARYWLPQLVAAAVLAFALLGLAGALVIQQGESVGAERGWLAAAHLIAPLSVLLTVPLLCGGRYGLFRGHGTLTPAWTLAIAMPVALGLTALAMLSSQQLRRHPPARRARLAWLMSMNVLCVAAFAALAFANMFIVVPSTCCPR